MGKIAEMLGYTRAKIWGDFRYWGIPRRSHIEAVRIGDHERPKELRERIANKLRGRKQSPELIMKRADKIRGYKHTEEWKKLMSKKMSGRQFSEETRKKMSSTRKRKPMRYWLGKKRPEVLKWLKNPFKKGNVPWNKGIQLPDDLVKKLMRSNAISRPTRPEKKVLKLIQKLALPFRYCGDGSVIIGAKVPDFINYDGGKQLIEVFGDYWHRKDNPKERIEHFKKYGFETLIIWEHELENEDEVINRLLSFAGIERENGFNYKEV
jgi:very-short-patch-repair endonuclease